MPYLLLANPAAGSGAGDLPTRAERALNDVRTIELGPDVDLATEIERAIGEGRTVIACGGDGTVNAAAQHLAGTHGVLGVLPGGTLNHFARDLGVRDPDVAIATLAEGHLAAVDVGRADDVVFVNNIGFGAYPEIVREREDREGSVGKWVAFVASVFRVMVDLNPVEGTIEVGGARQHLGATALFVGNNRFSTSPGSIGQRDRLDEGVLDVRIVRSRSGVLGRASAGWRTVARRPRRIVSLVGERVDVRLREPRLAAIDGERGSARARMSLRSDPGALRVLAPPGDAP
ncbi:MAG: diacylglycerol kinase family protein [Actinomycetota bacterium]